MLVGDLNFVAQCQRGHRFGIATVKALRRDDYALSNKACKLRNVDLVICEGKRVWKALHLPRMVAYQLITSDYKMAESEYLKRYSH